MSKRKSRTTAAAALPAELDGPPARKGYDMRDGLPFCLRCNRTVDEFEMATPILKVHGWHGPAEIHTGEVIATVRCHGETWVMWKVISHG